MKAVLALLLALCVQPALADARVSLGLHFGIPLYWPAPYSYPPYYYPAPLYYPPPVIQYTPPPYAEGRAPQPAEQAYSWYYCADSRAYYPYVRECPGGWQRISPIPPPPVP